MSAIIPIPKIPITVRPATMDDLSFIDGLQKIHTKQVGWMPEKALVGKIKLGHVLVAWASRPCSEDTGETPVLHEERVGYLIGNDQYFKRDDVGIIYQMNVVPGKQRGFVGATLLKAQFERSAYGCRLYCCWCAQDIDANRFWESMGFVPLAFRAGSEKKQRVHIFWQKRIRTGDETTPYWFPAQTNSGSIREDRLVLPIPPGKSWSDEMPRILPSEGSTKSQAPNSKQISNRKSKIQNGPLPPTTRCVQFGRPSVVPEPIAVIKTEKAKKPKVKNDPKLVAAARELRDRWLERVNEDPSMLLGNGKYEVSRILSAVEGSKALVEPTAPIPLLPYSEAA